MRQPAETLKWKVSFLVAFMSAGTAFAHGPPPLLLLLLGGPGGGFTPVGSVRPHSLVVAPDNPRLKLSLYNPEKYSLTAPQLNTQAVFAGPSWNDPSFAQDQLTGLATFLGQFDGSTFAGLRHEYLGFNASIGYSGATVLPIPINLDQIGFPTGGAVDATVAYVCDAISVGQLTLNSNVNNNLLIFTDAKRVKSDACAYRMSSAFCPGRPDLSFRFTVFFDMTEDKQCQVPFHPMGQSRGLSSLANLTARSLMETQTDPDFVGYEDAWGNNLDDLCAWSFHVPFVTFPDGSHWKLQDLWSNRAYRNGSGHPNQDGKKGCVNAK